MKNLLFFVLTAAVFATAQAAESPATNNREPSELDKHSGLYLDAGIGIKLVSNSYNDKEFMSILSDYDEETLEGTGPEISLKAGWLFQNLVAVYGTFGMNRINADYTFKRHKAFGSDQEYNTQIKIRQFFLGAGAHFYPFRNPKSVMKGSYAGASLNYINSNENDYCINSQGIGIKFEIGKGWHISEHWLLGVGYTITAEHTFKRSYKTADSEGTVQGFDFERGNTNHGLEFKIIRK